MLYKLHMCNQVLQVVLYESCGATNIRFDSVVGMNHDSACACIVDAALFHVFSAGVFTAYHMYQ